MLESGAVNINSGPTVFSYMSQELLSFLTSVLLLRAIGLCFNCHLKVIVSLYLDQSLLIQEVLEVTVV